MPKYQNFERAELWREMDIMYTYVSQMYVY